MLSIQEQAEQYEAVQSIEAKVSVTYAIPMKHRLWIETNWERLGYRNRSHLVQAMVAAFIERQTAFIERHQTTE